MNLLLVRLRLIGDVVFTTPSVRAIRRRFPDARISYLVEADAAPVVRANPHLDEVIVAVGPRARGRLLADLRLARLLRSRRFDVVIDFHGGPRAAWLALASGAPVRIGYDIRGRRWMYTRVVPRVPDLHPRHSVLNQWDLLAPLGLGAPDRRDDATEMPADPVAEERVWRRLRGAGVEPRRDHVIVVHVSAGNPFRRWPAPSFAELVARLAAADARRRIVLTSGPSEADAAARVGDAARAQLGPERGGAVVTGAEYDLAELRALIGGARLFIGGDSGPLHIASTTRTPIVGLYGPTLAARSAPWRDPDLVTESAECEGLGCRPCDQRRCAPGDYRCLASIEPRRVVEAAERALRRAAAPQAGEELR